MQESAEMLGLKLNERFVFELTDLGKQYGFLDLNKDVFYFADDRLHLDKEIDTDEYEEYLILLHNSLIISIEAGFYTVKSLEN